jgi:hypothetical protein
MRICKGCGVKPVTGPQYYYCSYPCRFEVERQREAAAARVRAAKRKALFPPPLYDPKPNPPERRVWYDMIRRCTDTRAINWKYYGGRGIEVCGRWRESFDAFYEDVGPRPAEFYTLDRINNDGNYEPGNCRWATRKEQQANTRARTAK